MTVEEVHRAVDGGLERFAGARTELPEDPLEMPSYYPRMQLPSFRFYAVASSVVALALVAAPRLARTETGASAETTHVPTFADYAAAHPTGRKVTNLDFSVDPRARRFRTQFKRALGRPSNFAAHYVVLDWGCGSNCQAVGLVDVDSGAARLTISTGLGSEFHADSRLFVDSPPAAVREMCAGVEQCLFRTHYFVWDEDKKAFGAVGDPPAHSH